MKYRILKEESLFKGFFEMKKVVFRHDLYRGGMSSEVTREIFERGHSSCVLLFDPQIQKVVLVEQFRIAAKDTTEDPWLLELVAGMIDSNLSAEEIAIKEAKEEANIEIKAIEPIYSYLASPGAATEKVYLFLGIVDASQAGGIFGLETENEDILVKTFNLEEVESMLNQGAFQNAPLIISIQWLLANVSKNSQKYTNE